MTALTSFDRAQDRPSPSPFKERGAGRLVSRRDFIASLAGGALLACSDAGDSPLMTSTAVPNVQQESRPTPVPGTTATAGQFTWSARAPLPTPRSEVASAVLDGKIYVIAGFVASGQSSNVVEVYDPLANAWSRKADLPEPRDHAMAAALGGKVYVFGGGLGTATRSAFAYDLAADRWLRVQDMPFRRTAGGAAVLSERIVVVGGTGDSPLVTMSYDPSRDGWGMGPGLLLPAPREHLAVTAAEGKVYVIAGRWDGALKDTNLVADSTSGQWRALAPMPTARGGTAGGVVNGRIYVAGGEAFDPTRTFAQVEVYDPATDAWSKSPDLPTPRHGLAVQGVGDTLYVIGGGPTAGLSVSPQNEALSIR